MICDRCSQPITRGQSYTEHVVETGSVAAPNVVLHADPCSAPAHQTAPARPATGR